MVSTADQKLAALAAYLAEHPRKRRWLVLTHDNPDPDALASAHVIARVLRHLGARATAAYGGIIGRAENREMMRALKLGIAHARAVEVRRHDAVALVDTQPGTGNNQLPDDVVPDLVLDHHPRRKTLAAVPLPDVRPEYGATATIAAEYLLASGHRITAAEATALVYAILTETQDFSREASGPDHRIHDLLLPRVSKRAMARIQHPRLPLAHFRMLHQALENLESVGTLLVCHVGAVSQPDVVPEIADLLVRMEGKTWSLCTGRYQDRLYLSLRTTNARGEAGQLMRRLVGRRGRGGGHGMTGGGWVALGSDPDRQERRLAERLARALRKPPDRLTRISLGDRPPSTSAAG
jgi:nanoRNase/pAp phosphatase (c-di-AMP/oligoRNAs hydrolase)